MSGGVDSSLAAHLLVEQGFDVTGVYLECWRAPGCRTDADRKDALDVALELGLPFQVLDFKQAYRDKVVEYFFTEYQAGRTPNPDVMCNREIKFGLFYDWAMTNGFDYVATGHYAAATEAGELHIPADVKKDQTYFLYVLTQDQLRHTLFPLAELTKPQVREQASQRGLAVASKKDSTGICFIGDINVHEFLRERLGENPGNVVDTDGNIIGEHQGLWFYTVGQRHGFTVQHTQQVTQADGTVLNKHLLPPFYVIAKKPATNELVVGFGAATYRDRFTVSQLHSIAGTNSSPPTQAWVRIRHTGQLLACTMTTKPGGEIAVQLTEPIQGLAAGQAAVFYLPTSSTSTDPRQAVGWLCWGGGTIEL